MFRDLSSRIASACTYLSLALALGAALALSPAGRADDEDELIVQDPIGILAPTCTSRLPLNLGGCVGNCVLPATCSYKTFYGWLYIYVTCSC